MMALLLRLTLLMPTMSWQVLVLLLRLALLMPTVSWQVMVLVLMINWSLLVLSLPMPMLKIRLLMMNLLPLIQSWCSTSASGCLQGGDPLVEVAGGLRELLHCVLNLYLHKLLLLCNAVCICVHLVAELFCLVVGRPACAASIFQVPGAGPDVGIAVRRLLLHLGQLDTVQLNSALQRRDLVSELLGPALRVLDVVVCIQLLVVRVVYFVLQVAEVVDTIFEVAQ